VADSSYLRFPHLAHNLLTFVAEDDVWLAPLDEAAAGTTRAWRLTSDRVPVSDPRLNPSAAPGQEGVRGGAHPGEFAAAAAPASPGNHLAAQRRG
jgi:hypothetical protein